MKPASLLVAFLLLGTARAQNDPGWTQPRANARGTAAVDYATVTTEPVVRWRRRLGRPLADPVSWGATVYVAHAEGRGSRLTALNVETGEVLADVKLGGGERLHLAVWQGTVVAVGPEGLNTFRHEGGRLKFSKRISGVFLSEPCLVGGRALLTDGESLTVVDVTRGRAVARIDGPFIGRPAFLPQGDGTGRLAVQRFGDEVRELELVTLDVERLGHRKPRFGDPRPVDLGVLRSRVLEPSGGRVAFVARIADEREVWYVGCPGQYARLVTTGRSGSTAPAAFRENAAVYGDALFGVSERGTFGQQTTDGRSSFFEGAESSGAHPAAVTIADGVALLGNRAVEIGGRRVLWRLEELDPGSTLIPVAPGWIVAWATRGELLGIRGAESVEATPEVGRAPSPRPEGTGIIGADGRFRPGAVEELPDGRWRVTAQGAEPLELDRAAVAWVESGEASALLGDEYPVYVAWREALDSPQAAALVAHFEGYAEVGMLADCRRLLDEMRSRGLSAGRLAELEKTLIGKTQNVAANADRKRARVERGERETLDAFVEALLRASDWCRERDLPTAATALLAHADRACAGVEAVHARTAQLIPDGFPGAEADDAAARWLIWADEMLPAGASFLLPDSEVWDDVEGTVWAEDTIGFVTRNLVLLSRCDDPSVLGPCLRNGEGTLRVLESILGPTAAARVRERMQVRLHANREEFDAEGKEAVQFFAGYYMPTERISRFYVPDGSVTDPLGRQLHEVLAHELTHQYITERWVGSSKVYPVLPGNWVVEGFARFIEDQVTELGQRAARLDDRTVKSLETMVQLAKEEVWHPFEFVDWTKLEYLRLSNTELRATVRLRNTLGVVRLNDPLIFYEQAGSLVFFLWHDRGEEGRAALIDYMRGYYRGETKKEGWKALGFESAEDLRERFLEFLRGLQR